MAKYSSNSGESIDDAIVITGVANHNAGVKAEYDYVIQKHGQARVDWNIQQQSLTHKPFTKSLFRRLAISSPRQGKTETSSCTSWIQTQN